ncbi:NUDIX hydrolase [uncultured Nocardioides sp.]|uniref:NUDIX domain-containing protein n=1 Tax=uncultured Nocardioides sp. TaxID=198441 RepID=UPI0026358BC2|nr:NUDIX hydrolase [uncultured Nocardioides sp.]
MSDAGADPQDLADREGSWEVVSSRPLYEGEWVVNLREDVVRRPGHTETHSRTVMEHPGAVVVLAVDDATPGEERVCCLRQYRHAGPGWFVELPAGLRDAAGEDPVDVAVRELREEVELEATDWRPLLTLRPSVGISDEVQEVFLARGLSHVSRGDFELHAEEAEMEVFWAPVEDLLEAALDGRLGTSPVVAALLAYDALRRRGRL